jgi:3-oxoadipate enol-lactonase
VSELYREQAGDGPPVVLVHAGICDSRQWDPQWQTFPRSHRTIRYDMRGFGRSALSAGAFSHARDLIDLLDELELERAALVGNSQGGQTTLEVAVAEPERVEKLVLVAPGLPEFEWSEETRAGWTEESAAIERGDLDAATDVAVEMWVVGPRREVDEVDPGVRERTREMQRRALEHWLAGGEAADEELLVPDVAERLGAVQSPTLVVTGEEDRDEMQAIADRLAAEIPNARRASIAGAAHVPSLERPEELDRLVLDFLK